MELDNPIKERVCAPQSSASLREIKFIIKTSILPPTPTACPSTKRIQKFLQNGGDSSFEQSMEFKPINALSSKRNSSERRQQFSEKIVVPSTSPSTDADPQNTLDSGDVHSIGEDNERLDVNLNGSIARRLTQMANDVEKILKKPKLTDEMCTSPVRPLIKSSSSTNLPEHRSSFFGLRSLSLTPSPSLFRKSYSSRHRRSGSSVVQEKLVLPTIVITSTPMKESSAGIDADPEHVLPSPLSKENMQIFESECEMQDVSFGGGGGGGGEENMEFSYICEPAESECGDPFNDTMETSATSSCDLFQPPLEPVFNAEPSVSLNSMTSDAAVLKRCQSGPANNCKLSVGEADVTALSEDAKEKESRVGTTPEKGLVREQVQRSDDSSGNNKENEFSAPDKKCLNSKRVKSATVRVLHALTAKSLGDELIESCANYPTAKSSPFRRYGQISSSFRSQLTATEAKKMLTGVNSGPGQNTFPVRPRSYASSESDVYHKSFKQPEPVPHRKMSAAGKEDSCKKTQVLDWNSSFEILLSDIFGVHAFAEFLKKEFSAENIYFWTACERYKQLESAADRFPEAQLIFAKHLEEGAPEPVNIDSKATSKTLDQLKLANIDLFDAAQKQIFNLMKFDSYARFIKSDIYKQCLDCEMKKLPPPYPENRILDAALSLSQAQAQGQGANLSPVKLKKSVSNAEDRRRKSLLPWHRKTRSKSKDRNEEKKDANANSNNIYSSRSSLSSFDAVLESTENHRSQLCRVILPNGATTIVQTRSTETIRELVVRLVEKRGLSYTSFEVFVGDSNKPCDLEGMSTRIAGKQVNIEQRVTFKLDLPNKKVISVKSKPEKVLEEVLRPILFKYNYALDAVQVRDTQPDHFAPHVPITKLMVTQVDGRRLVILDGEESMLSEITSRVFNEIMPEHGDGSTVSVKKLADYMNCRFAGQQMIDEGKRSVIAKWKSGAKLQSPTVASVDGPGRAAAAMTRDQLRPSPINLEMPAERPTPAPRLSIAKNTSLSSINNSQDSGVLSNRSGLSTGTSSTHSADHSLTQLDCHDYDNEQEAGPEHLKSPPPLPPKPKVLPIKGPNWSGPQPPKNIYLDQPTSSFV